MGITALVGQNSFLLGRALAEKRTAFVAEYGDLALEAVDVNDWETRKVMDTLAALPFLTAKRMVIMRGLAANKPAAELIDKILDGVSDTTELLIVESKIDKRSVLYKTLKKQTNCQEFNELDPRELPRWLTGEAKRRGGDMAMSDAMYLVNRVGAVQQMLSSEIDKLLLYNMHITRATIDLMTEQAPLSSIFDLIDAAFTGNFSRALSLYDDQRAQNVEPLAVEALFVWQLHILLLLKAGGKRSPDAVAAEAGVSPYVAKKSASLAARRTLAQLKNYVTQLLELEYTIKTQGVDADELMKNYILLLGH